MHGLQKTPGGSAILTCARTTYHSRGRERSLRGELQTFQASLSSLEASVNILDNEQLLRVREIYDEGTGLCAKAKSVSSDVKLELKQGLETLRSKIQAVCDQ